MGPSHTDAAELDDSFVMVADSGGSHGTEGGSVCVLKVSAADEGLVGEALLVFGGLQTAAEEACRWGGEVDGCVEVFLLIISFARRSRTGVLSLVGAGRILRYGFETAEEPFIPIMLPDDVTLTIFTVPMEGD